MERLFLRNGCETRVKRDKVRQAETASTRTPPPPTHKRPRSGPFCFGCSLKQSPAGRRSRFPGARFDRVNRPGRRSMPKLVHIETHRTAELAGSATQLGAQCASRSRSGHEHAGWRTSRSRLRLLASTSLSPHSRLRGSAEQCRPSMACVRRRRPQPSGTPFHPLQIA